MKPDDINVKIEHYAALWARLNAINALIEDLETERTDIKVKQRQLANAIVSRKMAEQLRQET